MDWQVIAWCTLIATVALLVMFTVGCARRDECDRRLKRLVADAKAGKLRETSLEEAGNGVISLSEDGFVVHRGAECLAEVKWDAVEEIRAYKADLFGYDLICWGFCSSGEDSMVETDEGMVGFKRLQEAAGSRYGVCAEDWWHKVALPAFATNMTVIWSKKGNTEDSVQDDS